ncbi:MAG TPA: ribosome maturation factor RimM [Anseongella sp.]|nr:ribosome maturation factor RimM [Anseongella sp.]
MPLSGFFVLGYISKTKGLKGEVQLKAEAELPEEYQQTESVFLELKGRPVPFFVLSFRLQPGKKTAILLLEDVDSVEAARELTGTKVLLPLSAEKEGKSAPFAELEGYQVIDRSSGPLGNIRKIEQYPGNSVAVLTYRDNEVMFPLNEALIERIDKQNSILFVNLPEGLLEIYLD